jgi:hypothetical protein
MTSKTEDGALKETLAKSFNLAKGSKEKTPLTNGPSET